MDVEQRSGQMYNSELPSSYVGIPAANNSNMNQFLKQKSKLRKQLKSRIGSSSSNAPKSNTLTPTFDVLPKIETNRYAVQSDQCVRSSHMGSSTNNSSVIVDNDQDSDLPISEAFTKNNVDEWLKMPSKVDNITPSYQAMASSALSSGSGNMLTPVEVDYFTDCTSVTSSEWGDDVCEFDKNESHKVNQMFEEIEWMLFADNSSSTRSSSNRANRSSSFSGRNGLQSGPLHLRRECNEWTHQFPHFRLVGRQISVPQEQGYTFNESDGRSGSVTPKNSPRILVSDIAGLPSNDCGQTRWVSTLTDIERLSLVGHGIRLKASDWDPASGFDELSVGSSQEEVFALDGDMVEIIAIDYKMDEDYSIHNQKKGPSKHTLFRNGKGYPPITPNAVIRDAVLTAIFDNLWSHVVDWVLPLLTRLYQSCSLRDIVVMDNPEPSQQNNFLTPDIYRVSKPFPQFPIPFTNNLDNILKISTKTLQFREKSYLQSIPEQSQNLTSSIKGSFGFNYGAPKPSFAFLNQIRRPSKAGHAAADRSQTPLSVNNESSFLHDKDLKRTPPLNQSYFVSSIASEGLSPLRCLRGKALYQSHSPELLARSGTLPPIHKYSALTHFRHQGSRIGSAQIQISHNQGSCSSSSIMNHSLAGHVLMTSDIVQTRPCTSHTARSDQVAGNRGSTPNGSRRPLNLNVNGSSITMNTVSMKTNEELPYDQMNKVSRTRPYWKTYNNQMQSSNKRNKSVYNSVK